MYVTEIWRRFTPSRKPPADVQKRLRKPMSQSLRAWAEPCRTIRGGFRLRLKGLSSLAPNRPCLSLCLLLTFFFIFIFRLGCHGLPVPEFVDMAVKMRPARRRKAWCGAQQQWFVWRAICQARHRLSADRPECVAPNGATADGAVIPVGNGAMCNV